MQTYYDAEKKHERDAALESAKQAATSAGAWGGSFSALGQLLGGNRSFPSIAARALGSAATWGALGGGANYLGHEILGAPAENDPSAGIKQSAVGGAVGGGVGGAGLGYLLGSGKLSGLKDLPGAGTISKIAHETLPLDNMVTDMIKSRIAHPSRGQGLKLAATLGLLGAGLGGFNAATTGMESDTNRNLTEEDEHARQLPA